MDSRVYGDVHVFLDETSYHGSDEWRITSVGYMRKAMEEQARQSKRIADALERIADSLEKMGESV